MNKHFIHVGLFQKPKFFLFFLFSVNKEGEQHSLYKVHVHASYNTIIQLHLSGEWFEVWI